MAADVRKMEIRVGAITILAIVLLLIGVALGKGWIVGSTQQEIRLRFSNASGIDIAAPVWVNGVKRGSVTEIIPEKGSVVIKATIDKTEDFASDASAKISMLELTGGKKIDILPGKSQQAFDASREIQGESAADFVALMGVVDDLGAEGKKLFQKLDSTLNAVNKIVGDERFVTDLKQTAANANSAVSNVAVLINDNKSQIHQSVQNLHALTADLRGFLKDNDPKLRSIIDKLDKVTASGDSLLHSADNTLQKVDKLVVNVNDVVKDIRSGEGALTKIMFDKAFSAKLDSALINIEGLVTFIRDNGVNVNVRLGTRP